MVKITHYRKIVGNPEVYTRYRLLPKIPKIPTISRINIIFWKTIFYFFEVFPILLDYFFSVFSVFSVIRQYSYGTDITHYRKIIGNF